ncbi:hypothetical protein [Flavobacterium sp. SM2513]|uniref:hypothetical protein n=1 Tax=Flavobacterium sp. SM2513 TaxID=3424766 RepID=UPI003D7FE48A
MFLTFTTLYFSKCFAEGQSGLEYIVSFGYLLILITNILLFTIIIGLMIKVLYSKLYPKVKGNNVKVFSILILISILLTIIFQDKFTFLIFDVL